MIETTELDPRQLGIDFVTLVDRGSSTFDDESDLEIVEEAGPPARAELVALFVSLLRKGAGR